MQAPHTLSFHIRPCSLGHTLVACTTAGVIAILLGDSPDAVLREFQSAFPAATIQPASPADLEIVRQVVDVVEGTAAPNGLRLDLGGTPFARKVWSTLQDIPAGETRSYADIAAAIAQPKAVRAVARACAANVLAIVIPCHRVVRSDGTLSGYRWGASRKEQLLQREQVLLGHRQ